MNILLIEDDEVLANKLAGVLLRIARKVLIAGTLAAAETLLARPNGFDVVFLDLNLPDSRTLRTIEEITRIKGTGRRVVVMTGYLIEPEIVESYGADAFIDKRDIDFVEKVKRALRA